MAQTSTQPTLTDWDEEKAKQDEIAAQIASDGPVKSTPQVAGTAVEDSAAPKVTLRSKNVEQYPLTVSVVGAGEDGLVFKAAGDTIDVSPEVAEQVTYMPNVEVVA